MAEVPQTEVADEAPPEINWEAHKSVSSNLTTNWYILAALLATLLITATFVVDYYHFMMVSPWLASAVIIAGLVALITRGLHQSALAQYSIGDQGVNVDGELMPYDDIKSYSVIDMEDHDVLRLWSNKRLSLPTSIVLENIDPQAVSDTLSVFIPEEINTSSVSDRISKFIKF